MTKWNLDADPKTLLTLHNTKIVKGEKEGYITAIMHLAPHKVSGEMNTCAHASVGCAAACLNMAGHGGMGADENGLNMQQAARIQRTRLFKRDREMFMIQLVCEIGTFLKRAEREKLTPAIRLNGTSDLPWENIRLDGMTIFELFPDVQFYDYTKYPIRLRRRALSIPNYHLTFSLSEDNDEYAKHALSAGINVAVVLDLPRSGQVPTEWKFFGTNYPVVDGDENDLRFLDPVQGGIVALRAKGTLARRARGVEDGFIRRAVG